MAKRKKRVTPKNRKAAHLAARARPDVFGLACGDCCAAFAPGWEVSASGDVDPCAWLSDIAQCHKVNCWWGAQVPDQDLYPNWLASCSNLAADWQNLCVIPD
jgi:hypothetical protein